MRHNANILMKARGLPQSLHRLRCRTANFGSRLDCMIFDVFANAPP